MEATMFAISRSPRPTENTFEGRLNRLFNDALGSFDWQFRDSAAAAWTPPVDIFEQDHEIRILAELPGVQPENVKLSVEGNVLTLSGTKEQQAEDRTERVHRYERTYGAFERTFTLPATIDAGHIKAAYANGVLTVTLPKIEKAKPRQIQVEVAKS
jgi:HSP20 family protein